jgi:hypothetical protein
MLSGSIDPIDIDIAAIVSEEFSPKARSAVLAATAREALAAAQDQNSQALGRMPPHTTTVDGSPGTSEDAVRPDGQIDYAFQMADELVGWIREQLVIFSPVGTADPHPGLYRASHVLFADGAEIAADQPVPPAQRYTFFNTTPYARPIDRGESGQAPSGVYEALAALAQQRFGNQADISFAFIAPAGGGINDWAGTAAARDLAQRVRGGRRELHTDWLTRVPAIIVTTR